MKGIQTLFITTLLVMFRWESLLGWEKKCLKKKLNPLSCHRTLVKLPTVPMLTVLAFVAQCDWNHEKWSDVT